MGQNAYSMKTNIFELARFTADDWGISPGVNEGILKLAQLGIIRRVSVMANAPFVTTYLNELKQVPGLELGLHWNLTHGVPSAVEENGVPFQILAHPPRDRRFHLSTEKMILLSLNPTLRPRLFEEARRALIGQLTLLQQFQIPARYLDSHQHIHLIPGMLHYVGADLVKLGIKTVRYPLDWSLIPTRRFFVCWLALGNRSAWQKHDFDSLPCIYPFAEHLSDYDALLAKVLRYPGAEIIVHPAAKLDFGEHGIADLYRADRLKEYHYLLAMRQK